MFLDDFISKNLKIIAGEVVPEDNLLSFLKANINDEKRLNHSLSVAKLCYEVALSNGLENPLKYYLAGVLHDVGKNVSIQESNEIVDKYYHEYINSPRFAYHQFVGEYVVMKKLHIYENDFLKSIRFHCTGNATMSILEKVVYACDKIDPLRGYDSSELIKAMLNDVESGFKVVLKANYEFLLSKCVSKKDINESVFNELSKKCFKQYLNIKERK